MDAEARAAGQANVVEYLIKPVNAAGLIRPRQVTVDDHTAMVKRLVKRLAYMAVANLSTLAEILIESGLGPTRNVWPCEASVAAMANDLERCPPTEHRVISSWLASIEGPAAVVKGIEVELYWYLKKNLKPPVGGVVNRHIADMASENSRQRAMIRGRIDREVASQDDRDWLGWYLGERDKVRRIIAGGEAKRAGE